jgi:glycosyltransferase involved in cell wall biosynthesis
MNVLFIYENAINPMTGGAERITFLLANYLESAGCKVFFMGLSNDFSVKDERQVFLPDPTNPISDVNISFYLNYLDKNKIGVVINKSAMNSNISKLSYYCCSVGVKLVSVIHNTILGAIKNFSSVNKEKYQKVNLGFVLPLTDLKFVKKLMLFAYKVKYSSHYTALCKHSDYVILESDKFKEELAVMVDKTSMKSVIAIPNFLILEEFPAQPKKNEVLYVGRINTAQKRVDLLLEVWKLVHNKFPDWELKLVGGGDELDYIQSLSSRLRLDNITFYGYQDARSFYESASIICLTSSYEGFGIALIEAMSRGAVPVAFNSYLSVTDIIDDKKTGFLVTPFDIEEYANILSALMASHQLLQRCSVEAKKHSTKFDLSIIGKQWLAVIGH